VRRASARSVAARSRNESGGRAGRKARRVNCQLNAEVWPQSCATITETIPSLRKGHSERSLLCEKASAGRARRNIFLLVHRRAGAPQYKEAEHIHPAQHKAQGLEDVKP